jgi:hypothetical protein
VLTNLHRVTADFDECCFARSAVATSEALLATILAIETSPTGTYLAVLGIGRQVLSAS